jgi:hypothetical protein
MPRIIREGREVRIFRDDTYHHAIIQKVNNIDTNEVEVRIGNYGKATIVLAVQTNVRPTDSRPTQWLSGEIPINDFVPPLPAPFEGFPDLELDDTVFGLLDNALVA